MSDTIFATETTGIYEIATYHPMMWAYSDNESMPAWQIEDPERCIAGSIDLVDGVYFWEFLAYGPDDARGFPEILRRIEGQAGCLEDAKAAILGLMA